MKKPLLASRRLRVRERSVPPGTRARPGVPRSATSTTNEQFNSGVANDQGGRQFIS